LRRGVKESSKNNGWRDFKPEKRTTMDAQFVTELLLLKGLGILARQSLCQKRGLMFI